MKRYSAVKKKRDMNSQDMKIKGRTLNAHQYVKEANLQRLHTIYSQLYDYGKDKTIKTVRRSVVSTG